MRRRIRRIAAGRPGSAPKLGKHWLADLNLNPRYRGAAGYGAEVVRKNQEDYVDACWDQIGDILAAEMKFNLTRLAIEALGALKRKHFDVLPPERLMQVFGPALPRIEALGTAAQTFRINGQSRRSAARLDRSSMPGALVDAALRRVASPGNRALRMAARLEHSDRGAAGGHHDATWRRWPRRRRGRPPSPSTRSCPTASSARRCSTASTSAARPARPSTWLPWACGASATPSVRSSRRWRSANVARRTLAPSGVPELKIRVGQHLGVFTDLHVGRFGVLASNAPAREGEPTGAWSRRRSRRSASAASKASSSKSTDRERAAAGQRDAARRAQRPLHHRPRRRPLRCCAACPAARRQGPRRAAGIAALRAAR